jgi:hypothetical protein
VADTKGIRAALLVLLGLCAACALLVHSYNHARLARRTQAIKDIQTIQTAEVQYQAWHGRYAASLAELGEAGLIPGDLAGGRKGGFYFILTPRPNGYNIDAVPEGRSASDGQMVDGPLRPRTRHHGEQIVS